MPGIYRHPDGYTVYFYDPSTVEGGAITGPLKGRITMAALRIALSELKSARPGSLTTVYGTPFKVGTNAGRAPRVHFQAVAYD
jgi:hypothetical protein